MFPISVPVQPLAFSRNSPSVSVLRVSVSARRFWEAVIRLAREFFALVSMAVGMSVPAANWFSAATLVLPVTTAPSITWTFPPAVMENFPASKTVNTRWGVLIVMTEPLVMLSMEPIS